mgnify:FL=1
MANDKKYRWLMVKNTEYAKICSIFLNYCFNLRGLLFHVISKKFSSFVIKKKTNSQAMLGLIKGYNFNGKANKSK